MNCNTLLPQGTLPFYRNSQLAPNGTATLDSARFTCKCVVQQIDPVSGIVLSGGFGNGSLVVDGFDGDQYSPALKDNYSVKIYDANNNLWWGSSASMLPLGGGANGGGNVKVFSPNVISQ